MTVSTNRRPRFCNRMALAANFRLISRVFERFYHPYKNRSARSVLSKLVEILPESSSLHIGFYLFMESVSDLLVFMLSRGTQHYVYKNKLKNSLQI